MTPDYTMGCKRILPSNDYYRTLNRDNVDVVTDPIARITERGILTADGVEHEADVIVFGTGFKVQEMLSDVPVRGRGGRNLREIWDEEGMQAHRGTTVAGFPNLFMLLGPNTGLGHTSIIHMIESQVRYVVDALDEIRRRDLAAVEPKPEAQREFNRKLERLQVGTVWTDGGCRSLVPRRERPQHDDLARLHVQVPPPDGALRPRRVRDGRPLPRPGSAARPPPTASRRSPDAQPATGAGLSPISRLSISSSSSPMIIGEVLEVRERVAGAGEAEVELAGVGDAGDVERVAVHQQREREQRVEPGAVEVERLRRARDVRERGAERDRRPVGEPRDQARRSTAR